MASTNPLAATVEDYDSDTEATVNTTTKPPKPSKAQPPAAKVSPTAASAIPDAASDSGYSSRTAQTLGSADSTEKPTDAAVSLLSTRNKRAATATAAGSGNGDKPRESQQSAETSVQRPASKPPSRNALHPQRPSIRRCSEPNCPHCLAMNYHYRKSPLDSPWNLDYPPFAPPPARPAYHPPSPLPSPHPYPQYANYYPPPNNVPTLAEPHPRRRSTSLSRAPRPGSYHPGVNPEAYWAQANNPSRQDPGPPPAPSAYANPSYLSAGYVQYQQSSSPTTPYHPAAAAVFGQGQPPAPGYPTMRPSLAHRSTDHPSRRARPISMYDAQLQAGYDQPVNPNALVRRPPSRPSSTQPLYDPQLHSNIDRHRMPPPPLPPAPRAPARLRPEPSPRYASDYYDNSESSDSSGSSPHASTRTERPESRLGRQQSYSMAYQNAKQRSREPSENNRGRSYSFAREQRRDLERRASVKGPDGTDMNNENRPRRARTVSRPSRNPDGGAIQSNPSYKGTVSSSRSRGSQEGQTSPSKGGITDGFRIEVQRQGMDIDVNGQRISVVPKDGGVAELIFGPNQEDKGTDLQGNASRSQSTASERRRTSKSSKNSSEATSAAAPPAAFRRGSASSKRAGYTTDDSK